MNNHIRPHQTPNALTLKFIPENFLTDRVGEYKSISKKNPILVNELMNLKGIQSVFIGQRFISVTKIEDISWDELKHDVINIIDQYKDEICITEKELKEKLIIENFKTDIEKKICDILDKRIKPSVERDGGHIEFISYDPMIKAVYISLQGACSTCPHSKETLNNGVLNTLKYLLPNDVMYVQQI